MAIIPHSVRFVERSRPHRSSHSRSHHRRSSLFAASAADEAAEADATAAAAAAVTSLKCVAAIGRQSVTEEQAPGEPRQHKGPRTELTERGSLRHLGPIESHVEGPYTPKIPLFPSAPPSLGPLCDIAPLLEGDSVRPADKLCHLHRGRRRRRSRENRLFYPPIWILTIRNEGATEEKRKRKTERRAF